ncbi:Hypothetical_protein [Hexamita inflata]|uniref:Hypothetical_protein n=1 Tax=Hexamita inflata TaxID=28002 RepID=A0AA86TDA2_9EUKA|nr:Hypothetical protein HINF_LOCUS2280 [Hexamita inflata]
MFEFENGIELFNQLQLLIQKQVLLFPIFARISYSESLIDINYAAYFTSSFSQVITYQTDLYLFVKNMSTLGVCYNKLLILKLAQADSDSFPEFLIFVNVEIAASQNVAELIPLLIYSYVCSKQSGYRKMKALQYVLFGQFKRSDALWNSFIYIIFSSTV